MVLVQVSVVVMLLASTEAGATSATSAVAAVVKRIGKNGTSVCWTVGDAKRRTMW